MANTQAPRIFQNDVKLSLGQIESLELAGIFQNNWNHRTIRLYFDPESTEYVYAVGRPAGSNDIILSRDLLAECLNFRIALDYWKHGKKIYRIFGDRPRR